LSGNIGLMTGCVKLFDQTVEAGETFKIGSRC
jgi:hypothetical protein